MEVVGLVDMAGVDVERVVDVVLATEAEESCGGASIGASI